MEKPRTWDQCPLSWALLDLPCHNGFPKADVGQTWYNYMDRNPHPHPLLHGLALLAAAAEEEVEQLLACQKIDDWLLGEAVKSVEVESHEERR